ncbi:GNAT family N-acetyltransferase [Glutamicibacter sp. JL.03c]|uniref:GNAT family N-acetyltransferase n=1 Tax=Glutamicibacter sp. JL.03c TaxID=2984842 RepID=UPI0021F7D2EC|nr:GNAT family N-acetyltransferase [Glutamicibacter sp. JL.03c]UYQ76472.1 GNAT family N-acetyltransferase [Glutamicibacter sp. JL.03c]
MNLSADSPLFRDVVDLERQLLDPSLRHDGAWLEGILHEQFYEIGASGRIFDRSEAINLLTVEDTDAPALHVVDPSAVRLAEDLVQLRWATDGTRPALRSSIWIRDAGRWQMLFHQGTLMAQPVATDARSEIAPSADRDDVCVLRKLKFTDAAAVHEAFTSHPDMARQGDVDTPAKARAYVDFLLGNDQVQCPLAITINDRLVGLVCGTVDRSNANAWIWYWMHHEYRGRSLATRAVAALVDHLFDELGLFRLELGLRANNPGSRHVAESNGFLPEGIERGKFLVDGERIDVYTYARLKTDPSSNVQPLPLQLA